MLTLTFGNDAHGRPITTPLEELHHALVLGPTRVGKSTFLKTLAQQLVRQRQRQAVVMLEPGGGLIDEMEAWLAWAGLKDRMILFNPEAWEEEVLAWNVLSRQGHSPTVQAKQQAEAILAAFQLQGQDSTFHMPTLRRSLYEALMAVSEAGLPLTALEHLTRVVETPEREAIVDRLSNPSTRDFWIGVDKLRVSERQQIVGLLQARLAPILANDLIRRITNQRGRSLDMLRDVIEPGRILLCSLSPYSGHLGREEVLLLGNLLVQSVIAATFSRTPKTGNHVWLMVDEASDFITEETGLIMKGAAKYRLHGVWATQTLFDFKETKPTVYHQVMNNSSKIVFGDMAVEDLEILAPELFAEEIDLKDVKQELQQTKFRPVESERVIESWSEGEGTSSGSSWASGASAGESFIPDPAQIMPELVRTQKGKNKSEAHSSGQSSFSGHSTSHVPFYEFEEFKEVSSREFYSLEEQWHRRIAQLKGTPAQCFAFKQRGRRVQFVRALHSPDHLKPKRILQPLRRQLFQSQPFFGTILAAEREASLWHQQLLGRVTELETTEAEVLPASVEELENFYELGTEHHRQTR